jgi:hypothetical protein
MEMSTKISQVFVFIQKRVSCGRMEKKILKMYVVGM